MDTTLRDWEQTPNVSYTPSEKVQLAQLLLRDVQVDRIELASARVSDGEAEAVRRVTAWAAKTHNLERVEILGYTDRERSVDWIKDNGGAAAATPSLGFASLRASHFVRRLRGGFALVCPQAVLGVSVISAISRGQLKRALTPLTPSPRLT